MFSLILDLKIIDQRLETNIRKNKYPGNKKNQQDKKQIIEFSLIYPNNLDYKQRFM